MITRVGDSAQSARISGIIQQTQARVRDAQIQVSTGKTASSYASLPDKTGLLLRTQQERALTDASRETVLRLVDAGRRRLAALSSADAARALAEAAGLSAWRREALAWAVAHDAAGVPGALSLSELAWAGDPQTAADRAALDAWGPARLAATGELATRAPRGRGWEGAVAHDARAAVEPPPQDRRPHRSRGRGLCESRIAQHRQAH